MAPPTSIGTQTPVEIVGVEVEVWKCGSGDARRLLQVCAEWFKEWSGEKRVDVIK